MATNSSPEFPYPGGTPGAEPPDPVAGRPGHFAWSRWVKQFVKNLNTNLMAHIDAPDPHPQYLTLEEAQGIAGGGGVTDHGVLTGLADDDHPQYLLKAANPAQLSGSLEVAGEVSAPSIATDAIQFGSSSAIGHILTAVDAQGNLALQEFIGGGTMILDGDGPPADATGSVGNYYLDKTNHVLYGPKVVIAPVWPVSLSSGSSRASVAKTTASLGTDFTETGTIKLANGYRLYAITCSSPSRVRLYTTTAKMTSDASRPIGTDPTGDHGLVLEFVAVNGLLSADMSPLVDGFDAKATPDGNIPISITNTGGIATITVTLTWIRTE